MHKVMLSRKMRGAYCCLAYMLYLAAISGCVGSGEETSPDSQQSMPAKTTTASLPTLSPTATSTPFSAATIHPTATSRPLGNAPTPTPPDATAEPEEQETADVTDTCVDTSLVFENSEAGSTRWRLANGEYTVVEHSDAVYQIIRNPDPASSLVLLSVRIDSTVPTNSANVVVDMATGAFRILGADYSDDPRYVLTWLPEERIAWIDDHGEMYVGSLETQESLDAPARMTDLWFVTPDRILARDEAWQFWYFDLTQSTWSQLPPGESEKITYRWVENAAVADDGRHVFFFYQDYSAVLSNDSGTIEVLRPFDSPTEYYSTVDGTEGDTIFPPQQIKHTPYWFFPTEWIFREFAQISYPTRSFVVDARTGEVLGHEALGIPPEVAIYDSYLSPDETWIAVEVVEAIQTLADRAAARVARTWLINLSTGETRVADGAFAGWDAESQTNLDSSLSCAQQEMTIDLAPSLEG